MVLATSALWRCAVMLTAMGASVSEAKTYRVSVAAAPVDRAGLVVRFVLPLNLSTSVALRDENDQTVPLQLGRDREACFILAAQKAGEVRTFSLVESAPSSNAVGVRVSEDKGTLNVAIGGAPVLAYRTEKEAIPRADIPEKLKRAGYLHPVFSPAGRIVTGDYPSNHPHHHGIWTSWSRTEFQGRKPNFWEMAEQTGTVEFVAIDRTWTGPVHGGFVSRQRMLDLSSAVPVAALNETWELTVYDVPATPEAVRVFDLTMTQTCATRDPVVLPKYHYGGLGFRGPDAWDGKTRLTVLTSGGETQRDKANAKRARWCYLGGSDGGEASAGIAVLGSPENLRAPQTIRVHPVMPFFSFASPALGDFSITPDQPFTLRYRFIVTDGPPDRDHIEAWWNGYALPIEVSVVAR